MLQLMGNKVVMLTEKVDILSHRSIRGKLMSYFRIQKAQRRGIELFTALFSAQACELSLHRPQRHDARNQKDEGGGADCNRRETGDTAVKK